MAHQCGSRVSTGSAVVGWTRLERSLTTGSELCAWDTGPAGLAMRRRHRGVTSPTIHVRVRWNKRVGDDRHVDSRSRYDNFGRIAENRLLQRVRPGAGAHAVLLAGAARAADGAHHLAVLHQWNAAVHRHRSRRQVGGRGDRLRARLGDSRRLHLLRAWRHDKTPVSMWYGREWPRPTHA